MKSSDAARIARVALLAACAAAFLGAADAQPDRRGSAPEPRGVGTAERAARPDGVARVVAGERRWVLFEGEQETPYGLLPDGRIWLYDTVAEKYRLLTDPERFGPYFFAAGGALDPVVDRAVLHVNMDGDPSNLYQVDLLSGETSFLVDASSLGLAEILETTMQISPDGSTLAFAALREPLRTDASTYPDWTKGVYTIQLDSPGELFLHAMGDSNTRLYPKFGADGELSVIRGGPNPNPVPPSDHVEAGLHDT